VKLGFLVSNTTRKCWRKGQGNRGVSVSPFFNEYTTDDCREKKKDTSHVENLGVKRGWGRCDGDSRWCFAMSTGCGKAISSRKATDEEWWTKKILPIYEIEPWYHGNSRNPSETNKNDKPNVDAIT